MLGQNLQNLRKNNRISQKEMAEKLGVNVNTYANWENDRTQPSIEILIKIAQMLNISMDTLCGIQEKKEPYKVSRFVSDLSAACYSRVLRIEKNEKGISFRIPMDFCLYVDEVWDEDHTSGGSIEYLPHGTTEYFETLQNLIELQGKGLKNTVSVISSWVTDTIRKAKEETDDKGFRSTDSVFRALNGYDEE